VRAFNLRRPAIGRRVDLRRAVTNDFPLKATAVAVALLFWVAAGQNVQPREVTTPFAGRVPVERPEVPTGYVLRGSLGDVSVTLRGPEAAVARVAVTDLRAMLDISGADLRRGDAQDLPVRVTIASDQVKVVDVSPAAIAARIEPITTRTVAVQARFANEPPAGTQAGDPTLEPAEARVSGPDSVVAQVAAVYATVRFGDAGLDLVNNAQPVPVDAAGQPLDGLSVDPVAVRVSVPVLPVATTRTVPVLWAIRGAVANGFWLSRVAVDPPAVTVRGATSALGALDHLETAPIDVTGLNANRTSRVGILLPDGITLLRPVDATVTLTVIPLSGTRPFPSVAIVVANLGQGLSADVDQQTAAVLLAGPLPVLAATDQISAVVDAAGKGPGNYPADVVVRAPAGTTVQSVQPTRVTLTIRLRQP